MSQRIEIADLRVSTCLYNFIEQEVLPNSGIDTHHFWNEFSQIVHQLSPENKSLLATRDQLQQQIDQWHTQNQGENFDFATYKSFLKDINYIVPEVEDFSITTNNVDAELATMAGPQLVVPVMNARFALNAVNARWGSLYDALYGSDAISDEGGAEQGSQYNPVRGAKVIAFARDFLDQSIPLQSGSHVNANQYKIIDQTLIVELENGQQTQLLSPAAFIGFSGDINQPTGLLFKHNGLHFEVAFDPSSTIAKADKAGVSDIIIEAALTTIMDCEDSVAAVDAQDKVIAYKNWLGLIKGDLKETINKGGKQFDRTMNPDRQYHNVSGQTLSVKGRSLMFVRNVGHLMTNNAILDKDGNEVPEGIMDAMITSLISLHDLQKGTQGNSAQGSIYIVKPKMHGPDEVAFADKLFARVEQALNLATNTIKMGIMDEERRTSVNLKACINSAKNRVVFINTGFLDRTGDEIHTSMKAGPMARKADIKLTPWIGAYEDNNVDIGLACGFSGKAQIGKGMWPIPDQMSNMLATKINHVEAGANTAWVPSPTAAVLHALHYHRVDVFSLQQELKTRTTANIDDILTIPLAPDTNWSAEEISQELDNNAQGILGYVVRWIDQGIGCSKVPDINDVGLMEDRATLRISSQHLANWLEHNICTKEQVMASMKKMAAIVDQQNAGDPLYQAMSENFDNSIAFKAACDLVFLGDVQPNGYTEPLLHQYRIDKKAS
ncbi:malate synthase G [Thalassotalea sp. PLHSN55]|uniref:malate synthase G n=1 Tax=Thalassotalea sp. PLHSN55 TaxID=3435888 RepID=UPI003F82B4F3